VYMHKASIAEVYYDTLRFSGKEEAESIFRNFLLYWFL
jgi:hypothetical protein